MSHSPSLSLQQIRVSTNNLMTGSLIWPIKLLTKRKRERTRAREREKQSERDRNEGGKEKQTDLYK